MFKQWHIMSGYTIWFFCLVLYKAPAKLYIVTALTLLIEIIIISVAPWFFWVTDLPFQAGTTVVSEYSAVIFLRWIVVSTLEYQLLIFVFNLFFALLEKLILPIRMLATTSNEQVYNHQSETVKRGVGRPKKN